MTSATSFTPADPQTTRPTLRGTFGMVASTHWIATASAQAVLERGGNAFDAAAAAASAARQGECHDLSGLRTLRATLAHLGRSLDASGQGPSRSGIERIPARRGARGGGALAAASSCCRPWRTRGLRR